MLASGSSGLRRQLTATQPECVRHLLWVDRLTLDASGTAVRLKHLAAYVGDAAICNSQAASCCERKVKNAVADKRSAVGDANDH